MSKSVGLSILDRILRRKPRPPVQEAPPIINSQWGQTSEHMRLQAVANMRLDPLKRMQVEQLLIEQCGSVAKGMMEFQRRYPELKEDV